MKRMIFYSDDIRTDSFNQYLFDDYSDNYNEMLSDHGNSGLRNLLSSSWFLQEHSDNKNDYVQNGINNLINIREPLNINQNEQSNNLEINNDDCKSDFLDKKRNREEEEEEEKEEKEQEEKIYIRKINNKVKPNIFELKKMPTKFKDMVNTNDKTCGRKKKEDLKERAHNKNSEDNMINKIKTHFFLYLYEIINENVENEKYKVKKIPTKVISNLNVFENKELWNNTISNILKTYKISSKYSNYNEWENKNIVEKIEKSKKEIKVKKILNLEFKELFGIFRRKLNNNKDITKELLEKIKGLDLLNNNDIYCDFNNFIKGIEILESNEYIESIKNLCLDYENWFKNKVARILTKKNYDD